VLYSLGFSATGFPKKGFLYTGNIWFDQRGLRDTIISQTLLNCYFITTTMPLQKALLFLFSYFQTY
jgi:hypothetical protein